MGITKSEHFTENQNEIASQLKALGHPARVAIIEFLMNQKSCICNDIVDEIPLSQPTISQHLKELKNVNLIQGTIEGKSICYCINTKTFKQLKDFLSNCIETNDSSKNNSCC